MKAASVVGTYPQAIIFDLDGTLLDSLPGIQYSAQEALRALRPKHELPDLRRYVGPPIGEMFLSAIGDLTRDEIDVLVAEFRRTYDSGGWKKTSLFPGVDGLLPDLDGLGIRLFVASNKPSLAAGLILRALAIHSRFESVFCRDSRTPAYVSKSEAVGCLLHEHSLDPARAWMVGDGRDDYEAARCNGVRFVLADYGYESNRCREAGPSQGHIASPGDLLDLVQGTAARSEE
jgi:phosphoglycolate phosphatase